MRAFLAVLHGDMARGVVLAHRADALLPAEALIPRSIIPFALSSAHAAGGALDKAAEALREELRIGRAANNLWTVFRSLCDLADLHVIQGQLRQAEALCREALLYAEARGARQFGMVGYVLVKLGNLLYERDELDAAKGYISEGVTLMQGWQQPYEMVAAYTSLSTVSGTLGGIERAREALHKAEQIQARHPDYPKLSSLISIARVRLALAEGSADEAARQAAETRLGEAQALVDREREQMMFARVRIAQERLDEAMRLLVPLLEDAQAGGRRGHAVEMLVLQAVAWQRQGDTDRALQVLEKALELAVPEGYVRTFADHGATMATLLAQMVEHGEAPSYASGLLAAFEDDVAGPSSSPDATDLIEVLTDRELEVLDLISQGYSNQDIVEALVISLNTVKKHASNIYGKLGVRSRTQAVARAQELGLL